MSNITKEQVDNYMESVLKFYTENNLREGQLDFDANLKRFVIKTYSGEVVRPLTCGDIYIVSPKPGMWTIGQCEKHGDWKIIGTDITQHIEKPYHIIYHPTKRMRREHAGDIWFGDADRFPDLNDVIKCAIFKQVSGSV